MGEEEGGVMGVGRRERTIEAIEFDQAELRLLSRRIRRMLKWGSGPVTTLAKGREGREGIRTIWITPCLAAARVRLSSPSG